MMIETERLLLREMNRDDYAALYPVFADAENMRHYPYAFDEARIRSWIERNMNRYRENGFGLWAVCLKETGQVIGDCGLTLQSINGQMLPEIGYHIRRDCQRRGYAREAALAVRDWAFRNTDYPALYSYCKYTNEPSYRTAESIGMRFDSEYPDDANGITHVSVIRREDWIREMTEQHTAGTTGETLKGSGSDAVKTGIIQRRRLTEKKEKEWNDAVPGEQGNTPEPYEKTYRDGGAINECWRGEDNGRKY